MRGRSSRAQQSRFLVVLSSLHGDNFLHHLRITGQLGARWRSITAEGAQAQHLSREPDSGTAAREIRGKNPQQGRETDRDRASRAVGFAQIMTSPRPGAQPRNVAPFA